MSWLRALQSAILADADLAALAVLPEHGKVADYMARDGAIAQALRDRGYGSTSRSVLASEARNVLLRNLKWRAIVRAAANDAHPATDLCFAAVELAENAAATIDTLSPKVQAMLVALQAAGLIDADDRAELEALCRVPSTVSAADVSRALRGPWGDEGEV